MKPYVFFKTDDGRAVKYFDLVECDSLCMAVRHALAMIARDHHLSVEIWDGAAGTMVTGVGLY